MGDVQARVAARLRSEARRWRAAAGPKHKRDVNEGVALTLEHLADTVGEWLGRPTPKEGRDGE